MSLWFVDMNQRAKKQACDPRHDDGHAHVPPRKWRGVGGGVGHYWLSPLLEFVAPWVETGGLVVPGVMFVGSGLVAVALPPAVGTRSGVAAAGLVIGEVAVSSPEVRCGPPGMVPPLEATQAANCAGGNTSTAIGI
jgi:hypothetical protein